MQQLVNIAKKEQTHRHREQASVTCGEGEGRGKTGWRLEAPVATCKISCRDIGYNTENTASILQ